MRLFPTLQQSFAKHTNIKDISYQVAMQKLHIQQRKQSSKNSKTFIFIKKKETQNQIKDQN